jgi:hypothetical protein
MNGSKNGNLASCKSRPRFEPATSDYSRDFRLRVSVACPCYGYVADRIGENVVVMETMGMVRIRHRAVVLQARFTAKGDGGEAHNAYSLQPCTVEKLAEYLK